jgi:hypothetical protein
MVQRGVDFDFAGPFVHGSKGDRFAYLSWGERGNDSSFTMFRRAKLGLSQIDRKDISKALSSVSPVTVECNINLTDEKGGPICGSVTKEKAKWQIVKT